MSHQVSACDLRIWFLFYFLRLQVADVVISLPIASANDAPPLLVKLLQEGPPSTLTCPRKEALQNMTPKELTYVIELLSYVIENFANLLSW